MQKVYGTLVTVVVSIEQGWPFLFSTFDTVLLKLCKLHCTCNSTLPTPPPPLNKILLPYQTLVLCEGKY